MINIDFEQREREITEEINRVTQNLYDTIKQNCIYEDNIDYERIINEYLDDNQYKHVLNKAKVLCLTEEEVIKRMMEEPTFGIDTLRKEPGRTGWQEKYQYECLSSQSCCCYNWNNLPVGGSNALYLQYDGTIGYGGGPTKSIDFYSQIDYNYKTYDVYIAAKYTGIAGGAQDNQARDLENFAMYAPLRADETTNNIIVLIADGPYYQRYDFCNMINQNYSDRRVIATTTYEFDESVMQLLKELNPDVQ